MMSHVHNSFIMFTDYEIEDNQQRYVHHMGCIGCDEEWDEYGPWHKIPGSPS